MGGLPCSIPTIAAAAILSLVAVQFSGCCAGRTFGANEHYDEETTTFEFRDGRALHFLRDMDVSYVHKEATLATAHHVQHGGSRMLLQDSTLEQEFFTAASGGDANEVSALIKQGVSPDAMDDNGNTALIIAAAEGHVSVLRVLLDAGAGIDKQGQVGATALYAAAEFGQAGAVRFLIQSGADTEIRDDDLGQTPLFRAAVRNSLPIVVALVEAGADVDAKEFSVGFTPLLIALRIGHENIVKTLLDNGANIEATTNDGETALHAAAFSGNVALVLRVLDAGGQIDALGLTAEVTPITYAANAGHADVVRELIKQGANAGLITGPRNRSALHWAVFEPDNTAVLELLLNEGLDINLKDTNGVTPIALAALAGNKNNVAFLLDQGADPDIGTAVVCACLDSSDGCEPGNCQSEEAIQEIKDLLNIAPPETVAGAVKENNVELVEKLIEGGADVNASDDEGNTPLVLAAARGNVEITTMLLNAGADVNAIAVKNGYTALTIAAFLGNSDVVEILLLNGPDVDHRDDEGFTPLHISSQEGYLDIVIMLVDAGAEIDIQTFLSGFTPLALAVSGAHQEIVVELLERGADPTINGDNDMTLLHIASRRGGTEEVVQLLIDEGLDVDAVNAFGDTPIRAAAYYGNKPVILVLLEAGADPTIDTGSLNKVCGCVDHRGRPTLIQCPRGTCQTAEQMREIETLLEGDTGGNTSPLSVSATSDPLPPPSSKTGAVVTVGSQPDPPAGEVVAIEEDCSAFSTTVQQLECLARLSGN